MEVSQLLREYEEGEREFTGVDLEGADLSGVILIGVNLSGANLMGANLSRAFLSRVKFNGACLHRVNLSYAKMNEAQGGMQT